MEAGYSCRRVAMGSMRAARTAGIDAASAQAVTMQRRLAAYAGGQSRLRLKAEATRAGFTPSRGR